MKTISFMNDSTYVGNLINHFENTAVGMVVKRKLFKCVTKLHWLHIRSREQLALDSFFESFKLDCWEHLHLAYNVVINIGSISHFKLLMAASDAAIGKFFTDFT